MLEKDGKVAFHCRAKGIPTDVLVKTANKLYPDYIQCQYRNGLVYPANIGERYSVYKLYEDLHLGNAIEFDLCIGVSPCFDMKNFSIQNKQSFVRKLQFI